MQFVVAILIIGAIILFHEFGHFTLSKLCGVGVMEFSLGMGPVLLWRRLGETVYSLRAIPLGGFCAMYGEQAMESSGKDRPNAKGPDYKTDWTQDRSYVRHPKWQQLLVALAGPGFNALMAFAALVVFAALPGVRTGPIEITELGPVSVAYDAGLRVGDVITSVDGREVLMSQGYSAYIATHPGTYGTGYVVGVYRPSDGEQYEFFVKPDAETGLVGVTYISQRLDGPFGWLDGGWRTMRTYVTMATDSLAMLFRGDAGLTDMSGVIGITATVGDIVDEAAEVQASGEGESSGTAIWQAVLTMTALISVSVGVMNLLPLPALDGGRSLIIIGEMLTGRRLPERAEMLINGFCMIFLFVLMGIIMVIDLVRIFASM